MRLHQPLAPIMKTTTTILLLLLFLVRIASSQTITMRLPFFGDFVEIEKTIDSLAKENIKTVIVLKTELSKIKYLSEDSVLNIIIWPADNEQVYIKLISSKAIYRPFKTKLLKNIFNFPDKEKTFITKDERVFKFTPPVTNNNTVFYTSEKMTGYFEQPDSKNQTPITYMPNNKYKESIRKKWFQMILENVNHIEYVLVIERQHDRYKELFGEEVIPTEK